MAAENTQNNKQDEYDKRLEPIKQYMFKPGQSGNPNGRPKRDPEIDRKLAKYSLPAIERLCEIIDDPKTRPADAIKAAALILGYALGKPTQQIDVNGEVKHGIIIQVSADIGEIYASPNALTLPANEYDVNDVE